MVVRERVKAHTVSVSSHSYRCHATGDGRAQCEHGMGKAVQYTTLVAGGKLFRQMRRLCQFRRKAVGMPEGEVMARMYSVRSTK